MSVPFRLTLTEYMSSPGALSEIAQAIGDSDSQVESQLRQASDRLRRVLGLKSDPLAIDRGSLKATEMAGLVRVSPKFELEVCPKFLAAGSDRWGEDFFAIAALTRFSRLFPRERVGASSSTRGDLASLVGHAMAEMYWEARRRPLRGYRRAHVREFSLDGDVDPTDLFLPEDDGFPQTHVVFDRRNHFNGTILAAARLLLSELRDPQTRTRLERMATALSPQDEVTATATAKRIPSRHARWTPLYELSRDVLAGLGLWFDPSKYRAMGFALNTWRAWEELLLMALRVGLPTESVSRVAHPLGERRRYPFAPADRRDVDVMPDVTIGPPSTPKLLLDAKYKTRADAASRISEADLYEGLAFLRAAGGDRLVLLYPASNHDGSRPLELGELTEFERILVGPNVVHGAVVSVAGISGQSGFRTFALRLGAEIKARYLA